MRPLLLTLAAGATFLHAAAVSAQKTTTDLATTFAQPGLETAPWVFWRWTWNAADRITAEAITAELEAMHAQGIGGVKIDTVGSPLPGKSPAAYMSPEWLALIAHAKAETARLGMGFYIDDCDGWQTSGGPWITPENSMKSLTTSTVQVTGPQAYHAALPQPPSKLDFYRDTAVYAYAEKTGDTTAKTFVNISASMDAKGVLTWNVPAGNWTVMRVGYTTTGAKNGPAAPASTGLECDKLSPQGIEAHLHGIAPLIKVITTTAPQSKPYLGMDSWECGAQDWSETVPAEFKAKYGYDIMPFLPCIIDPKLRVGGMAGRANEDYWELNYELKQRNYMGRFNTLGHQMGFIAESQSIPESADLPEGEFWAVSKQEEIHGPKPAIFAGDPLRAVGIPNDVPPLGRGRGRNIIASESMTSRTQNWERAPYDLKSGIDWALCEGTNKICFHLWAFQPDLKEKPSYCEHGTGINRNLTWWPQAHCWLSYIARCQFLLRQGVHVSDVCFIHRHEFQPEFPEKYRYDVALWSDVVERMSVRDGRVVTPEGTSYRLLVMPEGDSISLAAIRKLRELVSNGAILLGPRPERVHGLSGYPQGDAEVQATAREMWGAEKTPRGQQEFGRGRVLWGMTTDEALEALAVTRDFRCELAEANEAGIDWNHRTVAGQDFYFVVNRAGKPVSLNAFFRVTGKAPELWDPDTGKATSTLLYEQVKDTTRVPLHLEPYASTFVAFRVPAGKHLVAVAPLDAATPSLPVTAEQVTASPEGNCVVSDATTGYQATWASGQKAAVPVLTERAPIEIHGPWKVQFLDGRGAPPSATFDALTSWTENADNGIHYYSGSALYSGEFNMDKLPEKGSSLVLDLGDVREIAEVKINGHPVATLWKPPFKAAVTPFVKAGVNQVEVTVVNTWLNRFVGDKSLPAPQRVCNIALSATQSYTADTPLPISGLLGPVRVVSVPSSVVPAP